MVYKARPKKIRDSQATIVGNWCGRANFFFFSLKIWFWIACTSLGPGVIKYRLPAKYRLPPPDTVSLMTFMYSFSMYMWRTWAWRLPSDSRGWCYAAGMKIEYERVWRVDQVNQKKKSRGGIFWCARARESRIFLVSPKYHFCNDSAQHSTYPVMLSHVVDNSQMSLIFDLTRCHSASAVIRRAELTPRPAKGSSDDKFPRPL